MCVCVCARARVWCGVVSLNSSVLDTETSDERPLTSSKRSYSEQSTMRFRVANVPIQQLSVKIRVLKWDLIGGAHTR